MRLLELSVFSFVLYNFTNLVTGLGDVNGNLIISQFSDLLLEYLRRYPPLINLQFLQLFLHANCDCVSIELGDLPATLP